MLFIFGVKMAVYVSHKRSALVLGVALLALDASVPLLADEAVPTDTAGLNDDIERLSIHYRRATAAMCRRLSCLKRLLCWMSN